MNQRMYTIQQRACRRKRKYTEAQARAKVRQLNAQGEFLRAYKCQICGGWHIGHCRREARLHMAFNRLDRERAAVGACR